MDMGPYLLNQPNPTRQQMDPTQPTFRNTVRKDTVDPTHVHLCDDVSPNGRGQGQ